MEKLLHEMRGILREIKPEFDKFAKDLKLQVSVGQDEWKTKSQETINLAQLLKEYSDESFRISFTRSSYEHP
jgi:hypothetical protein